MWHQCYFLQVLNDLLCLDNFSDTFRNLEDNLMFFILKKCKSEEIHYILFIM